MGIDRLLRGILSYRHTCRPTMVKEFQNVKDNPEPKAVFFTCMDSRMLPTRFTQTHVGDMFIVRNAGNLVPHSKLYGIENTTTEPAALELGCIGNKIKHVVVCGHSDCKAMNLLYSLREGHEIPPIIKTLQLSPLKAWLHRHGSSSLTVFEKLETLGFDQPLVFPTEMPLKNFVAYIDPENKFNVQDKLSQVNTLQQLANIASYGFMKELLHTGQVHLHALWFDIYTGDIYYFSKQRKSFVEINESTEGFLMEEIATYYT